MNALDTVIIGSGPGGYVAAIRAAQLGQQVTLIERNVIGGTCLNVGCVPSKALLQAGHTYQEMLHASKFGINATATLDFEKTQTWKNTQVVQKLRSGVTQLLKKNKVTVLFGEAKFSSKNSITVSSADKSDEYSFNHAILAVGSRPIEIKAAPFSKRILDSTGILNIPVLPQSLSVIGAGYIGCELAEAFAAFGTKVTLIEATPGILPGFNTKLSDLVKRNLTKLGVTIITDALVLSSKEDELSVSLTYKKGDVENTVDSEYALVSVGRRPNMDQLNINVSGIELDPKGFVKVNKQSKTTNPKVYAIGDITLGLALAHKASYEAKIVAEVISGRKVEIDYKAMPAVCYTTPEIATTGKSLEECLAQNIKAIATDFPLAANSRAIAAAKTEGFVRIISEENTKLILGAQIAGINASEIISVLTLAIETSLTLEDVALTIFPHPSVSEAIMDNTEAGLGYPIHI
ncbi:MAG: dihydrolipoamide dehydrogenase [Erysipelotrichaceae bacterium]|nr:MAG: dihydrolipoamide dehydrogenase [Erysipelotrichaceae bacterium]